MAEYLERKTVKRLINNNFSGLLASIDLIPAADVTPVGWISAKDKLPEPETEVLAVCVCGTATASSAP